MAWFDRVLCVGRLDCRYGFYLNSKMVDLHHHLGRDPRRPTVIGMQAFVKKTQKIPPGAIELALRRAKEIEP